MKKANKFYSLKSFRKDKAISKRFGDVMNRIISAQILYRKALEILKTHYLTTL